MEAEAPAFWRATNYFSEVGVLTEAGSGCVHRFGLCPDTASSSALSWAVTLVVVGMQLFWLAASAASQLVVVAAVSSSSPEASSSMEVEPLERGVNPASAGV